MNIEEGKFYRMRCGGVVRIESLSKSKIFAESDFAKWSVEGGESRYDAMFDLIAEITEAEYNRIVSGEAYESSILDTVETTFGKMSDEIGNLKIEIKHLKFENQALSDIRRFEAAKSAMIGRLFSGGEGYKEVANESIHYADALLKSLEESK